MTSGNDILPTLSLVSHCMWLGSVDTVKTGQILTARHHHTGTEHLSTLGKVKCIAMISIKLYSFASIVIVLKKKQSSTMCVL